MSFKLGRDHIIKCLGHLTSIQQGAIEGFSEKKGHVQIHLLERHVKELLALWLAESSPFAPFVNREDVMVDSQKYFLFPSSSRCDAQIQSEESIGKRGRDAAKMSLGLRKAAR